MFAEVIRLGHEGKRWYFRLNASIAQFKRGATVMGRFRGLIATVGGTADPIVVSIDQSRPEFVLFVVSEGSRETAELVAEASELEPRPLWDYCEISDPQNFVTSYDEISQGTEHWLGRRGLGPGEVTADITGGTKVMSAAFALAGVERFQEFTYVGGGERNKSGLGVVRNGTEYVVSSLNPWDTHAVRSLERANKLLDEYHAGLAGKELRSAAKTCSPEFRERLLQFAALVEKFDEADRFQFAGFPTYLKGDRYRELAAEFPKLERLGEHWTAVGADLSDAYRTPGRPTLLELLANARRRAKQARYDDGVVRLYRAVELYGQQLVKQAFGAELGRLHIESIQEHQRDSFHSQFRPCLRGDRYELGAARLYQSLSFSGDRNLRGKERIYNSLGDRLANRNDSLLAHGASPVRETVFNALWNGVMRELNIREGDIPTWPPINLTLRASQDPRGA